MRVDQHRTTGTNFAVRYGSRFPRQRRKGALAQSQLKPQDYVCRLLNYMKPTTALARAMETPKSTPRAPGPALALVMPLAIGSSDLNDVILRIEIYARPSREA